MPDSNRPSNWITTVFVAIAVIAAAVLLLLLADDFLEYSKSLRDYWLAFVSAIIGAGITLCSYFYSRRQERKTAVKSLLASLKFNDERCRQMEDYFANGIRPNFELDTVGIILWLSKAESLLPDGLIHDINWHRYQLDHINSRLRILHAFVASNGGRLSTSTIARSEQVPALRGHLVTVIEGHAVWSKKLKDLL